MKTPIIISISLAAILLALVLSWAVFVKTEPTTPVQPPIVKNGKNANATPASSVEPTPSPSSSPDASSSPSASSEIDTPDWKVYRNEEFGFEVRYPGEWRYQKQEGGLGTDYGINFINSENENDFIFFNLGLAIYSAVEDVNQYAQKDFEVRDFKIESKENVIVSGIKGAKYISDYNNPINKKYIVAYWPNELTARKDDFYLLETYIKPENKNNETTIINIFNQMLSTIKFDKS